MNSCVPWVSDAKRSSNQANLGKITSIVNWERVMKEPRVLKHATEIALIMEMGDWIKETYHPHNTYTHPITGKE